MTITDIESLNNIIQSLIAETPLSISVLSNKMSSTEFNKIMNNLQNTLDTMYEKVRYIQDLREYSTKVVKKEYLTKQVEFNQIYKMAKESATDYQDSSTIAHEAFIDALAPTTKIFDRNGSSIPIAEAVDSTSLLQANSVAAFPAKYSISVSSNIEAYNRNIDVPSNYRAYYIVNEPIQSGVTETINILFDSPCKINYVNVKPFGCTIDKAYAIKSDDNLLEEINYNDYRINEYMAKGIRLDVIATECNPESNTYDTLEDMYNNLIASSQISNKTIDTIAEELVPVVKEVLALR